MRVNSRGRCWKMTRYRNDENQPRRNEENEDFFLLFVFFVSSWFLFPEKEGE
jgi:hypothetical protein